MEGFRVLEAKCSKLHKKINYLAPQEMVMNKIYEYDIRSANTSCLRRAKKLMPETLDMIEELPKHDREVYIGKMIAEDKTIRETIADGITWAKQMLFMQNHIQDDEVLSIKNDAVYIIGRKLTHTKFGPIEFVEKGCYAMYMRLDKLEFYYDRKGKTVSIKGIKDEVVEDPDHQKGMIQFFTTVMEHLLMDRRSQLRRYLIDFSTDYKKKRLPIEYYKEFNRENIYRTSTEIVGWSLNLSAIDKSDLDIVNGIYNYNRYVIPIIQRFV